MSVQIFQSMIGATMVSVNGAKGDEEMIFTGVDGRQWRFFYEHDCCANCDIEDICGDLSDLVGAPILEAEEVDNLPEPEVSEHEESFTWTFYRFATAKGYVTVRWFGSSNGYYSESVTYEGPEDKKAPA